MQVDYWFACSFVQVYSCVYSRWSTLTSRRDTTWLALINLNAPCNKLFFLVQKFHHNGIQSLGFPEHLFVQRKDAAQSTVETTSYKKSWLTLSLPVYCFSYVFLLKNLQQTWSQLFKLGDSLLLLSEFVKLSFGGIKQFLTIYGSFLHESVLEKLIVRQILYPWVLQRRGRVEVIKRQQQQQHSNLFHFAN